MRADTQIRMCKKVIFKNVPVILRLKVIPTENEKKKINLAFHYFIKCEGNDWKYMFTNNQPTETLIHCFSTNNVNINDHFDLLSVRCIIRK